jgi:hypothetical protein
LTVKGTALTTLSLPSLQTISAGTISTNAQLTTLDLPALTTVNGRFSVDSDAPLATLTAPLLTSTGTFVIDSTALTILSLPSLRTIGTGSISNNAQLASVQLPQMTTVGNGSTFSNNGALSTCQVYHANVSVAANNGPTLFTLGSGLLTETCTWSDACLFVNVNGVTDRYLYCPNRTIWSDAQTICQTYGANADLLVINDATEYADIKSAATTNVFGNAGAWIGANDITTEGTWVWLSGIAGYSLAKDVPFWDGVEPNDSGGNEDCGNILTNGLANDYPCTNLLPFVCETLAR